jgi:hypothetical protein
LSIGGKTSQDDFSTSLNHNGKYVASKDIVGRRSTHDWFWRPEVDDGTAVFHRNETTKATLKHLAFRRPSGLCPTEANDHARARKEENVETHVVLSAVALVAASLTAQRHSKPGLIRSPSRLI